MSEHYFTAEPASAPDLRTARVRLAGHVVEVQVAAGVFSPWGVDKGTAVLLAEAPEPAPSGTFLDLGCGWGPLALTLALRSAAATVYAVDVNERAVDLTRRNAAALGLHGVRASTPAGIPEDVRFDLIWSNPPIRIGKAALHELLLAWLPRLAPGGEAYLVVQKNLGGDSLQRWLAGTLDEELTVDRQTTAKGFRVIRVRRGRRGGPS